jgi:HD-like signal output (HDOD) protein
VIPSPNGVHFDHRRFWLAASKRASLASLLAERVDPTRRSENFTAALLQDMAIPVLALRAAPYGKILDQWHNSDEDLTDLEMGSFGWHHGDVAAWMGSTWGFPSEFVEFMKAHHEGSEPPLRPAHVASTIREVDNADDELTVDHGSALLGLTRDEMVSIITQAEIESARLAQLLI